MTIVLIKVLDRKYLFLLLLGIDSLYTVNCMLAKIVLIA
jgi:hypothetical protein